MSPFMACAARSETGRRIARRSRTSLLRWRSRTRFRPQLRRRTGAAACLRSATSSWLRGPTTALALPPARRSCRCLRRGGDGAMSGKSDGPDYAGALARSAKAEEATSPEGAVGEKDGRAKAGPTAHGEPAQGYCGDQRSVSNSHKRFYQTTAELAQVREHGRPDAEARRCRGARVGRERSGEALETFT